MGARVATNRILAQKRPLEAATVREPMPYHFGCELGAAPKLRRNPGLLLKFCGSEQFDMAIEKQN